MLKNSSPIQQILRNAPIKVNPVGGWGGSAGKGWGFDKV